MDGTNAPDSGGNRIRLLAEECLDKAKGNWERAAKLMEARIHEDDKLFKELMNPLISQAVWQAIRIATSRWRRKFERSPAANAKNGRRDDAADIKAMGERRLADWLDYVMQKGDKLATATHERLIEEASMHRAFAVGNAHKADFFEAIASHVSGKKRVRDVFDATQLRTLWEQVSC